MPKLVGMLRVKDGILFINLWLKRMENLVDEIVVVDNGSTDGTLEILQNHPKVVSIARTQGFDEGRDKILVYQSARERKPDWLLWIDVDEIFEDRLTRAKLEKMMSSKIFTRYFFRRFHFHQDYQHFEARLDKLLNSSVPDRVLWKDQETGYFTDIKIHNGLIRGIVGPSCISDIRIKHLGSVDRDYLLRKTNVYLSVDPSKADMYVRHRDQQVKTWRWFEYTEAPMLIRLQMVFFLCLFLVSGLRNVIGKAFRSV